MSEVTHDPDLDLTEGEANVDLIVAQALTLTQVTMFLLESRIRE